jgi:hypothetical protein
MSVLCPSCHSKISLDDINVSTDLALCRACGRSFRYSALVFPSTGIDLTSAPSGSWFEQLPDGFRVGATTRSWMAVFLIPFTCVWSGISMSGIYGTQITNGRFEWSTSLFGLPFMIGTFVLLGWCAMTVGGQITLTRHADALVLFVGVGALGWRRTYLVSDFESVREELTASNWNRPSRVVVLEGKRRVTFASLCNEDRRHYLVNAIRKMLFSGAQLH